MNSEKLHRKHVEQVAPECRRCPDSHRSINGRYCHPLGRYVEHNASGVAPCRAAGEMKRIDVEAREEMRRDDGEVEIVSCSSWQAAATAMAILMRQGARSIPYDGPGAPTGHRMKLGERVYEIRY